MEKEKVRLILQNQRDLVDRLLQQQENSENDFSISELEHLLWFRFPFYNRHIIRKLNDIDERLSQLNFTCPFSEDKEGMMKMMVSKNQDLLPQFPNVLRAKYQVKFIDK